MSARRRVRRGTAMLATGAGASPRHRALPNSSECKMRKHRRAGPQGFGCPYTRVSAVHPRDPMGVNSLVGKPRYGSHYHRLRSSELHRADDRVGAGVATTLGASAPAVGNFLHIPRSSSSAGGDRALPPPDGHDELRVPAYFAPSKRTEP